MVDTFRAAFRAREQFSGYVTTLAAIAGMSARELEARLGFNQGALKDGFYVYQLDERVGHTQ